MTSATESTFARPSKGLNVSLWTAQALLALPFAGGGIWKIVTPIDELASMIPWAGQVSPALLYTTATFDLLGGLGVLLPSVTRVLPRVALAATLGCILLQISAVVFHFSRDEASDTPFNFLLIALLSFVYWGRRWRAPITPRL